MARIISTYSPVNSILRAIKNPPDQCQSGFEICHALAEFIERPQAENQIGAEVLFYHNLPVSRMYLPHF